MFNFKKISTFFPLFLKNNMTYLVLFCICSYILFHIYNKCNNKVILLEIKIMQYILIFVLALMINDIMKTPQEDLSKMIGIFLLSVILVALCNYLIEYHYVTTIKGKFYIKLFICIAITVGIALLASLTYFLTLKQTDSLMTSFTEAYEKNNSFLIFVVILFYFMFLMFSVFYKDTPLSDILTPMVMAAFMLMYIFAFIIFLCNKIGLINKYQYLTTFIVLGSITAVLMIFYLYFMMKSLQNICKPSQNNAISKSSTNEIMVIGAIVTIVGILWLDDQRNWHQLGYLSFIIMSGFAAFFVFKYSVLHPSLSLLSLWLMIEWFILLFYRNSESKNSVQFIFMKT